MDPLLVETSPGVVETRLQVMQKAAATDLVRDAIRTLLLSDLGFDINLFSLLYIRRFENGQVGVGVGEGEELLSGGVSERLFEEDQVELALDFFFRERKSRELGLDFERPKEG